MMSPEDFNWLDEPRRRLFMTSSQRMTKEEQQMVYDIYNRLTGEKKKPNGCGRCLRNTLKTIKHYYENYIE